MTDREIPADISLAMGSRVRLRRIETALSEEAVARAIGISVTQLRAAESGEARFRPEDIVSLSPILRVKPSWFFDGMTE